MKKLTILISLLMLTACGSPSENQETEVAASSVANMNYVGLYRSSRVSFDAVSTCDSEASQNLNLSYIEVEFDGEGLNILVGNYHNFYDLKITSDSSGIRVNGDSAGHYSKIDAHFTTINEGLDDKLHGTVTMGEGCQAYFSAIKAN